MKWLALCLILLIGFVYWMVPWPAPPEPASSSLTESDRLQPSFARLPLHFEPRLSEIHLDDAAITTAFGATHQSWPSVSSPIPTTVS